MRKIGGLLAIGADAAKVNYWWLAVSIVGLVVAHASNNMINDYFDLEGGVDTADYVRALYAPHPILSGMLTKGQLAAAIVTVRVVDAGPGLQKAVWPANTRCASPPRDSSPA